MSFKITDLSIEYAKVSTHHRSVYLSYTVTQTDGKIEKVRRCISENVKPCSDRWAAKQICKSEGVFPVKQKNQAKYLLRAIHSENVDRGVEAPNKLFCNLMARAVINPSHPERFESVTRYFII